MPIDGVMITNDDILGLLSEAIQSWPGVRIPVSGRSMGPAFEHVTDIMVVPCGAASIRLGSLVVFQRGGLWVVHRVVGTTKGGATYLTKGDGLDHLDAPAVRPDEIRGIVIGLGFGDGRFVDLRSPWGRLKSRARVIHWLIKRFGTDPKPSHRA